MKSLVMAAYLCVSIALGNVIASRVITLFELPSIKPYVTGSNRPNYYLAFVALIAVAGTVYAIVSRLILMSAHEQHIE